jgi:hypothetical protein
MTPGLEECAGAVCVGLGRGDGVEWNSSTNRKQSVGIGETIHRIGNNPQDWGNLCGPRAILRVEKQSTWIARYHPQDDQTLMDSPYPVGLDFNPLGFQSV